MERQINSIMGAGSCYIPNREKFSFERVRQTTMTLFHCGLILFGWTFSQVARTVECKHLDKMSMNALHDCLLSLYSPASDWMRIPNSKQAEWCTTTASSIRNDQNYFIRTRSPNRMGIVSRKQEGVSVPNWTTLMTENKTFDI